jgi:predicted  nucleic acid-binding Zn-ribbon protein
MTEKIFKGIKQVSAAKFNEAKESGLLAGYLWFVRTEVLAEGEEANTPENDNYDIYFGSKQYGHFRAGELDAIRAQIESLNDDIAGINEVLAGLVSAAETAQAAIAQEVEDRKAADDEIRGNIEGLSNDIRSEVAGMEEALRNEIEAGNSAVREEFAASQESLRTSYEQADADMGARIAVIEGEDVGKSMREVAVDELAKQLVPEGAKEALDTLEEIAAWIQQHPEDVAAMNAAIEKNADDIAVNAAAIAKNAEDVAKNAAEISTNAAAIAKNAEDIAGLNSKVTELESADDELDKKIDAVDKKVDEIPVITELKVNEVSATIEDGVAKVEIDGDNIGVGSNVPGYDSTASISTVLKGIIESFTAASDGTIVSVSSGDDAIKINTEIPTTPVISLNTEASTEETVAEGHIEIKKGTSGIYGVMYYSGDDAE